MRAGAGLAAFALLLATSTARAQEITLTGPLKNAPTAIGRVSYLPFELRGDVLFAATGGAAAAKNHSVSHSTGIGGALRYRRFAAMAWELDAGLLRGVEDASERRLLLTPRFVYIASSFHVPDWEVYAAAGPSLERITSDSGRRTFLGGELGLAIDRRVDPVFNRFVVELVLSERRGLESAEGWSTAIMLRIGIGTTFGIRQSG